ncbi:MAG: SAM-dependent methyltransferase [Sutterellaceae bacterium]|nr:SAM-dependent methyltransferase [Burkholderiaceae bacterium]MCX7902383.1 SAM-dependent methyltransferase [Burkholderiaceae bacterium]MDW8430916.1 SAM-dependent methyltransferase [Sutterellaceae bacterium]
MRSMLPPPSPEALAHSARLERVIAQAIEEAGGFLAFERYMELALYAPGLGYYAAGTRKFGADGDFVTAPEISPLFAQAIAVQVAEVFQHTQPQIVEFGAGSGALARDLLAALAARGVAVARYAIVEVSPDLRARQQQALAGLPVQWLDTPPSAFDGVMIANEVLDVMPVRLFVKRDGRVAERGVTRAGGALAFVERAADDVLRQAVDAIETTVGALPDGYGSEIGFVAQAWLRSAAEWLRHGLLLVIDYGFPRREYYHPQRLMGTIMCHYRHHAHADPLWLPGLNDITAHVDFSAAADAAQEAGLTLLGYTSQAHFLINCGVLQMLAAQRTPAHVAQAQRLLLEAEMGELFKVLAVGRGLPEPLIGFVRGDRRHTL